MTEKFSMNLAVRKICRRRGLDVSKFARGAGLSQSMLYQAMRKDTPSLCTLERCAEGFGMTLPELIAEGYPNQRKEKVITLPPPCGVDASASDELDAIRAHSLAAGEATYMARVATSLRAAGFSVIAVSKP
jgi:transcriptional regulator with XRE-family HTH domain